MFLDGLVVEAYRLDRYDNLLIMPLGLLALYRCSGEQARSLLLPRLAGMLKCRNT